MRHRFSFSRKGVPLRCDDKYAFTVDVFDEEDKKIMAENWAVLEEEAKAIHEYDLLGHWLEIT
jgi:hypothetical protein